MPLPSIPLISCAKTAALEEKMENAIQSLTTRMASPELFISNPSSISKLLVSFPKSSIDLKT
jgi:hypothetical protein